MFECTDTNSFKKVKLSCYRPARTLLQDVEAPRISRKGCEPYATAAFAPQEISLVE